MTHSQSGDEIRRSRGRITPSQIAELPAVRIPSENSKDQEIGRLWDEAEYVNVGERILGAYGGMQLDSHAGKRSTTDITAVVVHTLVDIYNHIAVRSDAALNRVLPLR